MLHASSNHYMLGWDDFSRFSFQLEIECEGEIEKSHEFVNCPCKYVFVHRLLYFVHWKLIMTIVVLNKNNQFC